MLLPSEPAQVKQCTGCALSAVFRMPKSLKESVYKGVTEGQALDKTVVLLHNKFFSYIHRIGLTESGRGVV